MNSLTTNGKLTEMECGANFAVILKDNAFFLPTEYKVLQSQKDGCFVKCMRILYNGKTELYYFAGELKSLSSLLSTIDAERFLTVLCNLLGAIINVQSNGFLTCRNIDASMAKVPNHFVPRKSIFLKFLRCIYDLLYQKEEIVLPDRLF